ncbi:hypothetical protein Ahy_B10g101269 [Arachis hypogaea]|uniref:Uncharacterized protein n=1 Tax=Arachis hypogaea TaxID=3818 RepID=A0A444WZ07_ARAHY|nr:hypothetical protein Ahy_B10g101269 [Arachis hypogaea]
MLEDDALVCADLRSEDDELFFGPIPKDGEIAPYYDAQDGGYDDSDGGESWHSEEMKTPPNSEDELEEVDSNEYFKSKCDLDLNKSSLTRVLGDARAVVYEDAAAQYGMVRNYGLTLLKCNPGSTVNIGVRPHSNPAAANTDANGGEVNNSAPTTTVNGGDAPLVPQAQNTPSTSTPAAPTQPTSTPPASTPSVSTLPASTPSASTLPSRTQPANIMRFVLNPGFKPLRTKN